MRGLRRAAGARGQFPDEEAETAESLLGPLQLKKAAERTSAAADRARARIVALRGISYSRVGEVDLTTDFRGHKH